ncbi:MAG TPA: hypothetical protein VIB78_00200, partial [Acidimicrobiia bacterium]
QLDSLCPIAPAPIAELRAIPNRQPQGYRPREWTPDRALFPPRGRELGPEGGLGRPAPFKAMVTRPGGGPPGQVYLLPL